MDGFCAKCGASLANAVNFCGACGAPVSSTPGDSAPVGDSPAAARRWPVWLPFAAVGAVAVAGLGWAYLAAHRTPPAAQLGASDEPAVIAPLSDNAAWIASYTDSFLSGPVTLVTSATARQRDYPTADGSSVQRTLGAGESVSGRWVRGRDPTTRWLRLASGGYVWEGNIAVPGGAGSPIAIPFSNASPGFGPEIGAFIDQANAAARARYDRVDRLPQAERERVLDSIETASTYVRVPNRRFLGLTVTAVAVHYEASSIYFREDVATVLAAWRAHGLLVDADGNVALPNSEAESCSINRTTQAYGGAYGVTSLTCGV